MYVCTIVCVRMYSWLCQTLYAYRCHNNVLRCFFCVEYYYRTWFFLCVDNMKSKSINVLISWLNPGGCGRALEMFGIRFGGVELASVAGFPYERFRHVCR